MTLHVGLTGGIASGKSTVARLFASLGVPVIDTDDLAREVVAAGSEGLAAVVARFGAGIVAADGSLDRRALRRIVFESESDRRDLEAITHPRIRALLQQRAQAAGGVYQIWVIPLLVEGKGRIRVDRVLLVDCPEALQIERVMQRDGSSREQAEAILAVQASRAARLSAADDVIVNDGDPARLEARVAELHQTYLEGLRTRSG